MLSPVLVSLLLLLLIQPGCAQDNNLQDIMGGFLDGMKEALAEIQKAQKPAADGKGGGAAQTPQDPMAGLKGLMESINPEQINQFLKNMGGAESLFSGGELIPAKLRELVPEEWRTKMAEVMASGEIEKLAEIWEGLARHKSGEDCWNAMRKKTPILAELVADIFEKLADRWVLFEDGLRPEAKEYAESFKSSFGHWISQKVLAPFNALSMDAKLNLRDSFEKAFPLFEPIMSKAVQSEAFGQWASELGGGAGGGGKEEKEGKEGEKEEEIKEKEEEEKGTDSKKEEEGDGEKKEEL